MEVWHRLNHRGGFKGCFKLKTYIFWLRRAIFIGYNTQCIFYQHLQLPNMSNGHFRSLVCHRGMIGRQERIKGSPKFLIIYRKSFTIVCRTFKFYLHVQNTDVNFLGTICKKDLTTGTGLKVDFVVKLF